MNPMGTLKVLFLTRISNRKNFLKTVITTHSLVRQIRLLEHDFILETIGNTYFF